MIPAEVRAECVAPAVPSYPVVPQLLPELVSRCDHERAHVADRGGNDLRPARRECHRRTVVPSLRAKRTPSPFENLSHISRRATRSVRCGSEAMYGIGTARPGHSLKEKPGGSEANDVIARPPGSGVPVCACRCSRELRTSLTDPGEKRSTAVQRIGRCEIDAGHRHVRPQPDRDGILECINEHRRSVPFPQIRQGNGPDGDWNIRLGGHRSGDLLCDRRVRLTVRRQPSEDEKDVDVRSGSGISPCARAEERRVDQGGRDLRDDPTNEVMDGVDLDILEHRLERFPGHPACGPFDCRDHGNEQLSADRRCIPRLPRSRAKGIPLVARLRDA